MMRNGLGVSTVGGFGFEFGGYSFGGEENLGTGGGEGRRRG